MASLHKDPRGKSPFWFVAYTLPDGKRRTKSTKQKEWKKAAIVKIEIEKSIESAKSRTFTETQAKKCLDDILESLGHSPLKNLTTKEFLDTWLGQYLESQPKTHERYKKILNDFKDALGDKAGIALSAITPVDIEAFKAFQRKEGKAAGTVNVSLKVLRAAFNTARKQGYILTNPAEAVSFLKKEGNTHECFTAEQIQTMLDLADWEMKGMILLGASLGIRIGDAGHLTWGSVNFEKGLLTVTPSKTGKPQVKPLDGTLLQFLKAIPQGISPKTPIFPKLSKKKVGGSGGLSAEFEWLMHKAGIDRQAKSTGLKGKGRQFFALGFHSLRASATSFMANSGVDKELRMKIIGHESEAVHDVYTHLEAQTLKKAVSAIPKFKI